MAATGIVPWGIVWSVIAGLLAGVLIGQSTEYYTSDEYKPTKGIANQARMGPATTIIDGLATGMYSAGIPIVTIVLGILFAFGFAGGFSEGGFGMGLYGIGFAAVGMLATLGITLATDAYGPIADNAGGNAEMAHLPKEVRERTDALDSLGNTTAATGKGFAIGSAALTAMALLASYIEEVRLWVGKLADRAESGEYLGWTKEVARTAEMQDLCERFNLDIMNPLLLCGLFLGGMMAFVFCAMTMKAVGRAAGSMVEEVRRQFKEIPGIMEGNGDTGVRQVRGHFDSGRSAGNAVAIAHGDRGAGPHGPGSGRGGRDGTAGRRIGLRFPAGHDVEQRRWCLGQCQEVHRERQLRRQGVRGPQGGRDR